MAPPFTSHHRVDEGRRPSDIHCQAFKWLRHLPYILFKSGSFAPQVTLPPARIETPILIKPIHNHLVPVLGVLVLRVAVQVPSVCTLGKQTVEILVNNILSRSKQFLLVGFIVLYR